MTNFNMTTPMTRRARAARALTATLAIVGVSAVLASVQTARAWDRQAGSAVMDDEINRQAAAPGYPAAAPAGPYASARRHVRVETPKATRKDFQDIK
ncbi:MAG TPA: hypothetical protein VKX28_14685 [Xanthobacteraceae bacterium]|nr:hypothetical protein [Xanthobacteraceae bacterium]